MGKLAEIQSKLKAPKSQYNKFGGYAYRSCEDILEALKRRPSAIAFISELRRHSVAEMKRPWEQESPAKPTAKKECPIRRLLERRAHTLENTL